MNTETNNPLPENLEQRLRNDAERIGVKTDDNFNKRVSNQLHPRAAGITQPAPIRSRLGWGLGAAAALALAVIVGRESLLPDNAVDPSTVASLELNLDKALASREHDLRTELQKVQNDLQRVESMLSLGGKNYSK